MVDGVESNYRTDEQLQAILFESGQLAPLSPSEQLPWLSANLQSLVELVGDPARNERLKKIVAGYAVPPIREPA